MRSREVTFPHLTHLVRSFASVLDPVDLGRLAVEQAQELLGATGAAVWLVDRDGRLVRLTEALPPGAPPSHITGDETTRHVLVRMILESGKPVFVADYQRWEHSLPELVQRGVTCAMGAPLISGDRTTGALIVNSAKPHGLAPEQLDELEFLAAVVAGAIETRRRYQVSEQQRADVTSLAELVHQGAREQDTNQVLRLVAQDAGLLLEADFTLLALVEGQEEIVVKASWGESLVDLPYHRLRMGRGAMGRAAALRETIVVEHLQSNPDFPAEQFHLAIAAGGRTVMATPILAKEVLLGALCTGWRVEHTPTARQRSLLETFASYAATIIENARVHEKEQRRTAQFAALVEQLPSGVLMLNANRAPTVLNEAGRRIFGLPDGPLQYAPGELATLIDLRDAHTGEPLRGPSLPAARALANQSVQNYEVVYRRLSDGQDAFLRWSAAPFKDAAGQINGAVGVFTDITRERQLLQDLAANEERSRALIENSSDVIVITDEHGVITFDNPVIERVLGYRRAELVGQILCNYVHPEDQARSREAFIKLLKHPSQRVSVEFRMLHKDASWRHMDVIGLNLLSDSAIAGILVQSRDVTQRKHAEEVERVRAAAVAHERERIAMDLHDGVIQSLYAVSLSMGAISRAPRRELLPAGTLRDTIARVNDIIADIRSYIFDLRAPSIEADRQLVPALQVLIEDVRAICGIPIQATLDFETPAPLSPAQVNDVTSIAHEALSNCVRHARASLITTTLAPSRGRLVLTIKDDGCGFDPLMAARGGGDGLRNMLERARGLNGRLHIKSRPGIGTAVRLSFPIAES